MAARDNKEKEAALPEGQAEKPKKKSKAKRIVAILVILIITLTAAGLGAYWWLYMRTPATEHAETQETAQPSEQPKEAASQPDAQAGDAGLNSAKVERQTGLPRSTGLVLPLPPITVNLSDPGGRRYLKLGMEVEVNSDVATQLKQNNARIRDSIIMLLAGKTYGEIASPDGKVLLKAEIAARLNQILGAQKVVRVYLTDFVVE